MKTCSIRLLVVLTLMLGTGPAGVAQDNASEIKRFAFGTPESFLRSGFTRVTVKDAFTVEKGYGFESIQLLEVFDRGGSQIVLPKDEYTARVYGTRASPIYSGPRSVRLACSSPMNALTILCLCHS